MEEEEQISVGRLAVKSTGIFRYLRLFIYSLLKKNPEFS